MQKNMLPNQFEYAGIYVEGTRTLFPFKKPVATTFMSGMLVPLGDPISIFPGVKADLKVNADIRSNTMVCPPLDPIYIDFFFIWVPHRIVWNHFPQFLGENDTTAWTQNLNLVYPYVTLTTINDTISGIYSYHNTDKMMDVVCANHFLSVQYGLFYGANNLNSSSLPSKDLHINVLAMRGYYAAWNYLFRDENYQRPVLFSKGDTGSSGEFGYLLRDYLVASSSNLSSVASITIGSSVNAGKALLMPVNKFHDAFTSVLPQPQFGDAVELGVYDSADIYFVNDGSSAVSEDDALVIHDTVAVDGKTKDFAAIGTGSATTGKLVADLSNATAITMNQFRINVMTQRYLEALARGGRRTPEYYEAIYNVKNSVARKDYPELLTRSRYVIGVNQVVATADASGSDWTSHLGDTGAYSLTKLRGIPGCQNDFTEFGYIHPLFCVRSGNRYSQFVAPHFLRSKLLDEYNPYFDHIGDVGIDSTTVNVLANTKTNFGYQEAWWDERTQLSMANGAINKLYGSLKYWTLGEVFAGTLNTATPGFMVFNPAVLDDVFVSAYYAYPQFIIDAVIYGTMAKRMSAHSIPGITGRI